MKKNILKKIFIFTLILSIVLFIYPNLIIGDGLNSGNNNQVTNVVGNDPLIQDVSIPKFDDSFFPIFITSIVIIGILLFAMWKIFKSKRQF